MANENQVWTGSDGQLWLNNKDRIAKVQKFTFKQTNKFEAVDDTDSFATGQRLVGCELSGEITAYKTSFAFNDIMEQYKNKQQPTLSLVGKITNNDTGETKRISITDVTFTELTLFEFEKGKVNQDVVPFNAGDYKYL